MLDSKVLSAHFGSRLEKDVRLAEYTTSRVGGLARYCVTAQSADQLADDFQFLWSENIPAVLIGSGSNILISDLGLEAVVVVNKAKAIEVLTSSDIPMVRAESGATLGTVARQAALKGYAGLEWASTIPGTLGGAIYGNAGAHKSDMSQNLVLADILHREKGRLSLDAGQMEYGYRSSILKRKPGSAVVLSATLKIEKGDSDQIQKLMAKYSEKRRSTQPPGSSMGSMFKNPEGDHAGRLIEAAGLKATRVGGAEVSSIHANFMINDGSATAEDIHRLIVLVQNTVQEKFGVKLELEIELLGKWQD
jgi:UDP-N-acetylmuramate dehydrogenase